MALQRRGACTLLAQVIVNMVEANVVVERGT
jgi:hypothetical protein